MPLIAIIVCLSSNASCSELLSTSICVCCFDCYCYRAYQHMAISVTAAIPLTLFHCLECICCSCCQHQDPTFAWQFSQYPSSSSRRFQRLSWSCQGTNPSPHCNLPSTGDAIFNTKHKIQFTPPCISICTSISIDPSICSVHCSVMGPCYVYRVVLLPRIFGCFPELVSEWHCEWGVVCLTHLWSKALPSLTNTEQESLYPGLYI